MEEIIREYQESEGWNDRVIIMILSDFVEMKVWEHEFEEYIERRAEADRHEETLIAAFAEEEDSPDCDGWDWETD